MRLSLSSPLYSRHASQCHDIPHPTTQVQNQPAVNKHSPSLLNIISWNCCGYKHATQYLTNLLEGFGAILSLPNLSTPNMSTIPNFFSTRLKFKKVDNSVK